ESVVLKLAEPAADAIAVAAAHFLLRLPVRQIEPTIVLRLGSPPPFELHVEPSRAVGSRAPRSRAHHLLVGGDERRQFALVPAPAHFRSTGFASGEDKRSISRMCSAACAGVISPPRRAMPRASMSASHALARACSTRSTASRNSGHFSCL